MMDDAKIVIIGASGQLGTALRNTYPEALAIDVGEMDITNLDSVNNFDWSKYQVILNAAAYTNVDGAELAEGRKAAWLVNARAIANLSLVAQKNNLILVHISTDYVFDGTQTPHTEAEPFTPISVYGASKAAGDIAVAMSPKHYILRTSWVIGEGKNFVKTMLGLGQKGISPTVVADQVGRLTFSWELARSITHLIDIKASFGTYNISGGGEPASWADITRVIFSEAGFDLTVTDTTTAEYFAGKENIAPRPLNSTFDMSKIEQTGFTSRDWRIDLKNYIKQELGK